MVTWLTSHFDQQFAVLLGRSGPFAQCTPDRHLGQPQLSYIPYSNRFSNRNR